MKARPAGVRLSLPVLVTVEVVALIAFIALPPYRAGWWPAAVITAAVLLALVITVHRRNVAGWVAALLRWRSARSGITAAAAVDVAHGDISCGVRADEYEAVTMVQVAGRAYTPTFLRGSAVSTTTNLLPLGLLVGLLDQPGSLRLAGIDVVSAGARVRNTTGYPPLYSTLLADRPAAGRRTTQLIVRLDLRESVRGLTYRTSIGAAAAAATERILNALLQEGIRATALSAAELDEALAELGAGLATAPTPPEPEEPADDEPALVGVATRHGSTTSRPDKVRLHWREVAAQRGHLTTYYFSPEDITTAALNQLWALRSDDIVVAVSIAKHRRTQADGGGPVTVSALVRTNDPQRPAQPPTLFLNTLPGDQFAAALWPAPTARPPLSLPSRTLDDPAELQIPIGPTGVLVGAALRDAPNALPPQQRDDLVMWALTDPQQATRIVMDTSDFYVRQLLVRAVAVGESVAIYSDQPQRWTTLTQPNIAVVDRRGTPDFVPTIVVNDRPTAPPSAGLSATVITLGRDAGGQAPDLRFVQTSESTVRVSSRTANLDLAIVAFRQEQAWTG